MFIYCPLLSGFAYSQGAGEGVLGGLMAASAMVGLVGTIAFPRIKQRIGKPHIHGSNCRDLLECVVLSSTHF